MRIAIAIAASILLSACTNPWASVPVSELPKSVQHAVARPSNFVFGNYCGFGTRTGDLTAEPVNHLDFICYEHDSCYANRRNHCDCDSALVRDATAIRDDKTSPKKLRSQAGLLVASFSIPVCKAFPQGFLPPRPRDRRAIGLPPVPAERAE